MKPVTAALSFALSLAPCAALAGPADLQEPAALGGTVRDNQVELIFGPDVTDLGFHYTEGKATAEGAMRGVGNELRGDRLILHVYAERSGSEEMAHEWFERLGSDDHHMIGADLISGDTTRPKKLNFWLNGKLWINGEPVEGGLFLAQGHRMFTNNWWIGSVQGTANRCCGELRLPHTGTTSYCLRATSNNQFVVGNCRSLKEQDDT